MKPRTIVTALLLTFVAVCVGVLVFQELRPAKGEALGGRGHKVVVYYLHGMKRCGACRAIEAAAHPGGRGASRAWRSSSWASA